jgi:hypothetical protein
MKHLTLLMLLTATLATAFVPTATADPGDCAGAGEDENALIVWVDEDPPTVGAGPPGNQYSVFVDYEECADLVDDVYGVFCDRFYEVCKAL